MIHYEGFRYHFLIDVEMTAAANIELKAAIT